jgi:hypothetical protein
MKKYGVYSITFVTDHGNMIYIGSTIDSFNVRWNKHRRELRNGIHKNPMIQSYWNKYGYAEFEIIEDCQTHDHDYVLAREQFHMDRIDKSKLLNCGPAIPNPFSGRVHSEDSRVKMGIKSKGHIVTSETREKLRLSHLGMIRSQETRRKISMARLGKPGHAHTEEERKKMHLLMMGRIITPEARRKISQSLKGNKPTNEARINMSLGQKGRHHSEETKEKIRNGNKGKHAKKTRDIAG